jgi:AraC-like DNA-binding protein
MRAPLAIEEHLFDLSPKVHVTDLDEATEELCRVYVSADIRPIGVNRVNMRMNAFQLPLLTAGYLNFGVDIAIRADEVSAYYIDVPLSGRAVNRWRDGNQVVTASGSAAVFTPGTPILLDWSSDCGQICLKVSEPEMRRQLEAMLGRSVRKRITFTRRLDLDSATAGNWFDLVRILARESGRPDGILNHRLAAENMQQLLVQGLLSMQPHNFSEDLSATERAASSAVVRRAMDLMHAHPEKAWTMARLARTTCVSPSALQRAFNRSGQPPPMTYLRRLRLHRVNGELSRSDPRVATVSTVAARWGFLHMGRFAHHYRQQFGESPSETLRSAVSGSRRAPL